MVNPQILRLPPRRASFGDAAADAFIGPPDQAGPYGVSSTLTEAGHWVQYAEYSEGLVEAEGDENEQNTRYNLQQWWAAKADLYPTASPAIQADLNTLDMWAHRWWGQLESKLAVLSAGDEAKVQAYSAAATEAYTKSAALAEIIQNQRMTKSATNQAADASTIPAWVKQNIPDTTFTKALVDQFKTSAGTLGLFGLPWWVYAAGGVLLLVLLKPPTPGVTIGRR